MHAPLDRLFTLLFPQACLLCGHPLGRGAARAAALCDACDTALVPIGGPRCERCGQPLVSERGRCLRCRAREFAFAENYPLFRYEGRVRELIYQYKFQNHRRLARLFAERLAALHEARYPGLPVVPVPFRRASKRKRGWDQIEAIGEQLERSFGIRVLPLLRRRSGRPQKSLDYAGRLSNLRGRIELRARRGPLPEELMLLDDIFTTGATASECARVLTEAGVRTVHVVTLAID